VAGSETLVAIDVGTSGARAAAFDLDGRRLLEVRQSYPTRSPAPGHAEQDPRLWRRAALSALGGLVRQLGARRRVAAIGLTGQCPSVCLVDSSGRPVTAGLIYRDNRASREATTIRDRFGDAAIHARTGHLPSAFHIAPKLIWLKDHEPDAFARARVALQPRDLVAHALTGEFATDGTHAAATLVYDLRKRAWAHDLQEALGLEASLFPSVRPSWEPIGDVVPSVARRVGLPAGTPVVLGGADSQACALGAGVVAAGPVSEMAGSSTCLNAVVPEPLSVLEVTHYPHVVPGPVHDRDRHQHHRRRPSHGSRICSMPAAVVMPAARSSPASTRRSRPSRLEPTASWPCPSWPMANAPIPTSVPRSPACRSVTTGRCWPGPSSRERRSRSATSSIFFGPVAPR
jgi:sugar (pentulose or hexulose) kinase